MLESINYNTNNYVKVYGVGYYENKLPNDYELVNEGSCETIVRCVDGCLIYGDELSNLESLEFLENNYDFKINFLKENKKEILKIINRHNYNWDLIVEEVEKLNK